MRHAAAAAAPAPLAALSSRAAGDGDAADAMREAGGDTHGPAARAAGAAALFAAARNELVPALADWALAALDGILRLLETRERVQKTGSSALRQRAAPDAVAVAIA